MRRRRRRRGGGEDDGDDDVELGVDTQGLLILSLMIIINTNIKVISVNFAEC